jgi:hypothetical protein
MRNSLAPYRAYCWDCREVIAIPWPERRIGTYDTNSDMFYSSSSRLPTTYAGVVAVRASAIEVEIVVSSTILLTYDSIEFRPQLLDDLIYVTPL